MITFRPIKAFISSQGMYLPHLVKSERLTLPTAHINVLELTMVSKMQSLLTHKKAAEATSYANVRMY